MSEKWAPENRLSGYFDAGKSSRRRNPAESPIKDGGIDLGISQVSRRPQESSRTPDTKPAWNISGIRLTILVAAAGVLGWLGYAHVEDANRERVFWRNAALKAQGDVAELRSELRVERQRSEILGEFVEELEGRLERTHDSREQDRRTSNHNMRDASEEW